MTVRYRTRRPDDIALRLRLRALDTSAGASATDVCTRCCGGGTSDTLAAPFHGRSLHAAACGAARGWCSPCPAPPRCERFGARRAHPTAAVPQGSHGKHARCFPMQAWDGARGPLAPRFSIGRISRPVRCRKIKFDTIDNDRCWQIVLRERGRGVSLCSQRAQASNRPHADTRAIPPLDGDGSTRAQRFVGVHALLRIFQALRLLTRLVGIL